MNIQSIKQCNIYMNIYVNEYICIKTHICRIKILNSKKFELYRKKKINIIVSKHALNGSLCSKASSMFNI